MAHISSPKVPVPDGPNAGTQPLSYHTQGMPVGVALLIELGINLGAFSSLLGSQSNSINEDVVGKFNELANDPSKRKEILEGVGYDYEKLRSNKKYDDYVAIRDYCIQYISRQSSNLNYDHWIAWLNVNENQELLRGAVAMAPMYSEKWKNFYDTKDVQVFERSIEEESLAEDLGQNPEEGAIAGLQSYFAQILSVSNDHYDKTFQVYSMQIDSRLMCCILWFVGPLDTESLDDISEILRYLSLNVKINIHDMIAFITEGAATAVLNMLSVYSNRLINDLFNNIMDKLFKIPSNEYEVALKYCIGVDILFKLIGKGFDSIIELVFSILEELRNTINIHVGNKPRAFIQVSAERRYLTTLAALIDAIVANIELAQKNCRFDTDDNPQKINDLAAAAAVDFVSDQLPDLYPVMSMPEDIRRKFFGGVNQFATEGLGLPVPGYDQLGNQEEISREDQIFECGEGARAVEGLKIGKKIADIMEGKL
jgi:hypothetical protein